MIVSRGGQYYITVGGKIVGGPFKWHFQAKRAARNIKESTIMGETKMDKFTKVFEADMQDSMDKLEEANGTEKPTAMGGYRVLFGKTPPAEHIYKKGIHARAGAGKFAKIAHAGSMIAPVDLGAGALALQGLDKTAKAYLGKGGSISKGKKQGTVSAKAAAKRGLGLGAYGALLGGVMGASKGRKGIAAGAALGAAGEGALGAGGHALNQKAGELWYRRKARKMGVAESVLEETKVRIKCRQLEEAGMFDAAKGLWNAFKQTKAIKQAGTVVGGIKNAASSAAPRLRTFRKGGATKLGAFKNAATDTKNLLKNAAKDNPYGAALVGGGGAGTLGLSAWGLKKPKNKVQEAAPFDFSSLKDKKGKGKDKKKGPPAFAKKGEGKDEKKGPPAFFKKGGGKDGEVDPAKENLANAKDKAKKKKGKGKVPPQFLKNVKGGDKGASLEEGERVRYFSKGDSGTLMRAGGPMIGKNRKVRFNENMDQIKNKKNVKEINKKEFEKRMHASWTGSRSVEQEVPKEFLRGRKSEWV